MDDLCPAFHDISVASPSKSSSFSPKLEFDDADNDDADNDADNDDDLDPAMKEELDR